MELALSLGDASKPFNFIDHHHKPSNPTTTTTTKPSLSRDVGFCMDITPPPPTTTTTNSCGQKEEILTGSIYPVRTRHEGYDHPNQEIVRRRSSPPQQPSPLQLNLFPSSPVHIRTIMAQHHHPPPPINFPWLTEHLVKDTEAQASRDQKKLVVATTRNSMDRVDVAEEKEGAAANPSPPNSTASEFGVRSSSSTGGGGGKRESVEGAERSGLVVLIFS